MPADWGAHYLTCDNCDSRYHASEGGCGCQDDCKAYKPWMHGVWTRDRVIQVPCQTCPDFGECEWSGEEDAETWNDYLDKQQEDSDDSTEDHDRDHDPTLVTPQS